MFEYHGLEDKWWHRLFKVCFVVATLIFLIITILVTQPSTRKINSTIKNNLVDYAKQSDPNLENVIDDFLDQEGTLGCLEDDGSITYFSDYSLRQDSICRADPMRHFEAMASKIDASFVREYPSATEADRLELRNSLIERQADPAKQHNCLVPTKLVECAAAEKIVKYDRAPFYYLQKASYVLLALVLWLGFWWLIYYKGFLYIIYGRK